MKQGQDDSKHCLEKNRSIKNVNEGSTFRGGQMETGQTVAKTKSVSEH